MKNYKQFLEEISIKGNQGIPKDPDYLKNVEKRAKSKLGLTGDEDPRQLGP